MIYILVPIHNRIESTKELIRSLRAQTFRDFKVIFIDDGSVDSSKNEIARILPESTILEGNGKLWWAGSLQKGIEYLNGLHLAPHDVVCFMNNDVTFTSEYLQLAVESLEEPFTIIISGFSTKKNSQISPGGISANLRNLTFEHTSDPKLINCASTRGIFLTWETLNRIGNFRPKLLPHYLSDYEYLMRAVKKGAIIVAPQHLYVRLDSDTTGIHSVSKLKGMKYVKASFSKRNSGNPIYWSIFLVLVPNKWSAINILKLWLSFIFKRS